MRRTIARGSSRIPLWLPDFSFLSVRRHVSFLRWSSRRRLPLFRSATHAGSSEDWRGTAEAFTFVWFLRSVIGSMGRGHRHTALLGEDHMEQDFDARSQLSHGPLLVVPETIPQSSLQ